MATIPFTTIDTIDGLTRIADGFVHVTSNNTIYYVDGKHRIGQVWAGVLEDADYDVDQNPNNLRSQFLSTTATDEEGQVKNVMVYFDKDGNSFVVNQEGESALIYDELKELIDAETDERIAQDNLTRGMINGKQDRVYAGQGIDITGNIISNTGVVSLVAGNNVTIDDVSEGAKRISATNTQYSAGTGIRIDGNNVISLDQDLKDSWGIAESGVKLLGAVLNPGATVSTTINVTDYEFDTVNDYAVLVQPEAEGSVAWEGISIAWDKSASSTSTASIRVTNLSDYALPASAGFRWTVIGEGYGGSGGGNITLYNTTGQNTDGAMTQKATTDELTSLSQNLTNVQVNLQGQIDQKASQAELANKQDRLTAGQNIAISGNTISAVDTKYTAGTGISISSSNVISATSQATGLKLMTGTTDIGEGVLLAEDTIYGVYE